MGFRDLSYYYQVTFCNTFVNVCGDGQEYKERGERETRGRMIKEEEGTLREGGERLGTRGGREWRRGKVRE